MAAVLATQAIVLPRWPTAPAPLPAEQLEAKLGEAKLLSLKDRPSTASLWHAKRNIELATSTPVVIPLRGGYELTVIEGSMRQRFNFQAGTIARDQPSLKLRKRHLTMAPVPTAAGLAQDRPVLQTCLVRGPGLDEPFGVTREQLTAIADRRASGKVAALERVIGLQANRSYACTLISLRGPQGEPPSDGLWQQVLGLVKPVLQSQD
ncbi:MULTISPECIES: hypothetical protein [unclassified Cyanobium]|uniref:hypothetical protein n=1 Tax=unclassified Cyanobium TaxID=2627006 RepID=UPI0020CCBF0A|nr:MULTISPECIES: hypothetical protein [unclassified Cyanobium]MCP9833680.1 hypothetical protein [Cyanobium sp. La Preciosa 7G6]MCP9936562.1 hypothetical protein [Cyanobium sp. Aljojuca 7A6]